jgi:hypothetical protein
MPAKRCRQKGATQLLACCLPTRCYFVRPRPIPKMWLAPTSFNWTAIRAAELAYYLR